MKQQNDRDDAILEKIKNSPGIRYRELARATGIPNSTLGYYIKKLEKNQAISISRISKSCRFFASELSDFERLVIVMLRGKHTCKIILALEKEESTFSALVERLETHPSTISTSLKKLISAGLVENIGKNRFAIKNKGAITEIINQFKTMTALFISLMFYSTFWYSTNFVLFNLGSRV